MRGWLGKTKALALLGSLVLLLSGCGKENLTALIPKGYGSESSMNLIILTTVVMSSVLILVVLILAVVLIRFRKKKGQEDFVPKQVEGNFALEVVWTAIPIVLVVIMAVPTVMAEFDLADTKERSDHRNITVTGYQYWWHFDYEDDEIQTSQDLYIPVGERVYLDLISEDVLHSFWVPSLAGKLDVNPENTNTFYIEAYEEGVYYGKCAELCGESHALMDFKVIAVSPEDYEQWVSDMQSFDPEKDLELDAVAQEGQELFEANNCMSCHAIGGSSDPIGPNLASFGDRSRFAGILEPTKENLVDWIVDPDEIKPDNKMKFDGYPDISEEDAEKIAEYLMELKPSEITHDSVPDLATE